MRRGGERDELNYFSLDLSDESSARVKVYLCHRDATAADLERCFSVAPLHQHGDVAEFCFDMVGHGGPFTNKPVSSCFSFVEGAERPLAATFHLPIAHYVDNDSVVTDRVSKFLRKHELFGSDRYRGMIDRFSSRPTSSGVGTQSYTSFRRDPKGMRLTVYLSPELFPTAEKAADDLESELVTLPASHPSRSERGRRRL
jgi:hypothetical protein